MGSNALSGIAPRDVRRAAARIAVVGAGAAGTLTVTHLLASAHRASAAVEVFLVDPAASAGPGVAYSTQNPRHLMNVPARNLSAYPDVSDDLMAWLRACGDSDVASGDFIERCRFGRYLADQLNDAAAGPGPAQLTHVRRRAVGAAREQDVVRLDLEDGSALQVDSVVLALGAAGPACTWAPPALLASERFLPDPWAPGALEGLAEQPGDVLLVGTGLTMVDVALAVGDGRRVHAVSRSGRLPMTHRAVRREPQAAPVLPEGGSSAEELWSWFAEHLRSVVRDCGDWRPAVDGLRQHTPRLWASLSDGERSRLITRAGSWWNAHRHRMSPETAAQLHHLRVTGRLSVCADQIEDVTDLGDGLEVRLRSGRELSVAHVVACTGPIDDVRKRSCPLLRDLLASGAARPGPLGLGLATADARVLPATGEPWPIWAVGALRRGELWETTAIPEIRAQASALAQQLVKTVTVRAKAGEAPQLPRTRRRPTDVMGLPLSTTREAAAAYDEGLRRLMLVVSGAEGAFAEATRLDPGFALAHAATALLGHECGADVDVSAAIAAARAASSGATERERAMVEVVASRLRDCRGAGAAALRRHVQIWPRDVLAVSAAVPTIAFSGITDVQQETWQLVEELRPSYGGHWWFLGLLAFVRQDQGRYLEADHLSRSALAAEPASGHAVHAQTHVYYETGAHDDGLRWLDPWIATSGRETTHRAHFAWHAALHELSLGDASAVRRRYLDQLAPPDVAGVRALVDSASLLWRSALAGLWRGEVPMDDVLRVVDPRHLTAPETPFVAMHSAVALTALGDAAGLRRLAQHAGRHDNRIMRSVVVQLCAGMEAVAERRWAAAEALLLAVLPQLVRVGGSAALREVVEETLLHAHVQAGSYTAAGRLLEDRLDRRSSPIDRSRLRQLRIDGTGPVRQPRLAFKE